MKRVSLAEAKKNFVALLDVAQPEPIMIYRQSRGSAVLLSAPAYERLRDFDREEFQRFWDRAAAEK